MLLEYSLFFEIFIEKYFGTFRNSGSQSLANDQKYRALTDMFLICAF